MSECLVNCNRNRTFVYNNKLEKHLSEITYNLCMANLRDIYLLANLLKNTLDVHKCCGLVTIISVLKVKSKIPKFRHKYLLIFGVSVKIKITRKVKQKKNCLFNKKI